VATPHDALFRFTFASPTHACGWLASALPAVLADAIEWSTLAPLGESTTGVALAANAADVVFTARLRVGTPLLLVVEHKAARDPRLLSQLTRYCVHLRRAHRDRTSGSEPLVVPVILYHGRAPLRLGAVPGMRGVPRGVAKLLAPAQPSLRAFVDDLARCDEDALRRPGTTALAQVVLLALRFARRAAAGSIATAIDRWGDLLRAVERESAPLGGEDALAALACYLLEVTDAPAAVLHEAFRRNLGSVPETIMSTAERLRREGRAEGRLEGRAQGRVEGLAEALLLLLRKRFGELPPATVARVRGADTGALQRWTGRVLDAPTLDALFAADG
jgi:hypothetical protein